MPAKKRSKISKIVTLALVGLILFLGWTFATSSYFQITTVEVVGNSGVLSEEAKSFVLGKNLFFFPEGEVREKLTSNLELSGVTFERRFPNSLIVSLSFRKPILSWQSKFGRFLIDQEGLAYQVAGSENLPQVTSPASELKLGDKLDSREVSASLRMIEEVEKNFTVLTISLIGTSAEISLASGTKVILNIEDDLSQEQNALQLLLSQAKIDGRLPRIVDLRFPKPVVTY